MERSHWQIIWLLAQGHPAYVVARMTGYSAYWIGQVARRYNEEGEEGLVNHRNGMPRMSRSPLGDSCPPPSNSRSCARRWGTGAAGRRVEQPHGGGVAERAAGRRVSAHAAVRYLRLLDFTPQTPRPRHTKAASS